MGEGDQTAAGVAMRRDVRGQVALVTGGSRGLGRVVCRHLAAAGAAVALTARQAGPLQEAVAELGAAGGQVSGFESDARDPAAVAEVVTDVEARLGPVDLLVNNAAVITPLGPLWEVDAYAHANAAAYAVSKSALTHLTNSLGEGTAAYGLAVFAIDPGSMTAATGMTRLLAESEAGKRYYPGSRRMVAEGRGVPPERAGELVVRLASGEADALSGRFISVHDDLTHLLGQVAEIRERNLHVLRIRKPEQT